MKPSKMCLLLCAMAATLLLAACRADKPAASHDTTSQSAGENAGIATPTEEIYLPPADKADTPANTVQNFYGWYLDAIKAALTGDRDNPLANGEVARSGYLTPMLMHRVNELVLKFDEQGFVGLDPLWCAGITPPDNFYLDGQFSNNGVPMLLMRTNLPQHAFVVYTQQTGNLWQISDIACAGTPEGVVNSFYLWYLSRLADQGPAALTNGDYRASGFLSAALMEQVDAQVSAGASGDDPFLLTTRTPQGFAATPAENTGGVVLLRLDFGDAGQELRIRLLQEGGFWKIDVIKLANQ
ncbi:MAG: DUF3828 domain-containing protein [Anaerolineales bacterium]|nr:DUF3828 domain-containing protein [Anaerolineales bacterium]MCB8952924.1 DUF3828 domain-containing protein [Ardenticatenales bacterium]